MPDAAEDVRYRMLPGSLQARVKILDLCDCGAFYIARSLFDAI